MESWANIATCASRARRCSDPTLSRAVKAPLFARLQRKRRSESGFMLIFVLAVLVLVGVVGLALLMMTMTATKSGRNLALPLAAYRDIDRAMEETVQTVRTESSMCKDIASGDMPEYFILGADIDVAVSCETLTAVPGSRTHRFAVVAVSDTSRVLGRSQVRVSDSTHGSQVYGFSLVVCDWVLGKSEVSDLQDCPA